MSSTSDIASSIGTQKKKKKRENENKHTYPPNDDSVYTCDIET